MQARPGRHGQVWCIRRPEKGTWGKKSTDIRDRERSGDSAWDGRIRMNSRDMGSAARLPPRREIPTSCSRGAGEQMAKPTPLHLPVKPQLRAKCKRSVLLCKSTSVTHVMHLLPFHKGICCETTLAFSPAFTVQGFLLALVPALPYSTEQPVSGVAGPGNGRIPG